MFNEEKLVFVKVRVADNGQNLIMTTIIENELLRFEKMVNNDTK